MGKTPGQADWNFFTRRQVLVGGLKTILVSSALPAISAKAFKMSASWRAINIMNFIRAEEPRENIDLMKPVREQMALIKSHKFPATWLLQYDALVEGPYVEFLKAEMPPDHETGIWFEMNRKICDDAGITWRGNPAWEWDYHVPIAYAIGYSPDERRKLADTAMATFKHTFGHEAKTVASWNLDAVSIAHLSDNYGIDAFGNCRDQLATDGFTIWGAPIAAYYPNRKNAWSPALEAKNQISIPMFRLLGQDPVYYYDNQLPYPDTMEPVWASGQSQTFVSQFLDMMAHTPTQSLAYAQIGQENSFGWPMMSKAYAMQMDKLADLHSASSVIIETMGETGRRFKRSFKSTPTQAQVMLEDPFGKEQTPQRTVWYQSKYYRANLHFRGNEFYLRDLHVYNDQFRQPFLAEPVRQHDIEQRLLAVLDGYHWSDAEVQAGRDGTRALGRFVTISPDGSTSSLTMAGLPVVNERAHELHTRIHLSHGGTLLCIFGEQTICFELQRSPSQIGFGLFFEWVPSRSSIQEVLKDRLNYRFQDFDYTVRISNGVASKIDQGVRIVSRDKKALCLRLNQEM